MGPELESIVNYEHDSNTQHPAKLQTLYITDLNPYIAPTSSGFKMQLSIEITVSDFHLTARKACHWLENINWTYATDRGLQSLFSHALKLHMQDITLVLYFT